MMKWVAAGPVDELNIGVANRSPVIVHLTFWVVQHIGNAGNGYCMAGWVAALAKTRPAKAPAIATHEPFGCVTESDAATALPDLAEHCSQRYQHPIGLLAVLCTLQRPGGVDECSAARHRPRQSHNFFSG